MQDEIVAKYADYAKRFNDSKPWERDVEKIYRYTNEEGEILHETVRFKILKADIPSEDQETANQVRAILGSLQRFAQRRPHPENPGLHKWSINDIEPVLYQLPRIAKSAPTDPVLIVEGEKDADTLTKEDWIATTCPMGANKWRESYSRSLKGRIVVLIGDNDEAGERHVQKVARELKGYAKEIRRVDLRQIWEDIPKKADITDCFEAGAITSKRLFEAVLTAGEYEPPRLETLPSIGDDIGHSFVRPGGRLFYYKSGREERIVHNEMACADLYAAMNDVLYHPGSGMFYRYDEDTGTWRLTPDHDIRTDIMRFFLEYCQRHIPMLEAAVRRFHGFRDGEMLPDILLLVEEANKARNIEPIVKALKSRVSETDPFAKKITSDHGNLVIHVANGMLEIPKDGAPQLLPFDPKYRSRFQSPIAYNPEATCPRFLSELLETSLPDDEDKLTLQKLFGLFLTGRNTIQRIVLFTGGGGDGKGTLCEVIQRIIGEHNCGELRTLHLDDRFEVGRLYDYSLLVGADVREDFLTCEGAQRLKALTGNDTLTMEQKSNNLNIQFRGDKFVVATTNNKLQVTLTSANDVSAWRRRLVILQFQRPTDRKQVIIDFADQLMQQEGEGILSFAVRGLQTALKELQDGEGLKLSGVQRIRVSALLDESRNVHVFVRDRIHKLTKEEVAGNLKPERGRMGATAEKLFDAYQDFCSIRGWYSYSRRRFAKELASEMDLQFGVKQSTDICSSTGEFSATLTRGYAHTRIKPDPIDQSNEDSNN